MAQNRRTESAQRLNDSGHGEGGGQSQAPRQSGSLMACLDTTVFIDVLGRSGKALKARAQAAIDAHSDPLRPHATTRFNLAEMLAGVENSTNPVVERQKVDAVMEH